MARMILMIGVVMFALNASADVSGTWKGWGEWTFQGSGADCPTMWIQFEENKNQLKRVRGFFDCGIVALHSDPQEWTKRGMELFHDGKPAGKFDSRSFEAIEPYGDDVVITTKFAADGGHADYEEIWREKTGREIYVIRARLFNALL